MVIYSIRSGIRKEIIPTSEIISFLYGNLYLPVSYFRGVIFERLLFVSIER